MTIPSEDLLAAVCKSPEAVAIHDRQAWLDIFTDTGVVQDPIGTAPARRGIRAGGWTGAEELGAFYDTFIGPNKVSFAVHQDIVVGMEVIRDVTIHTRLATGLQVDVPAYLRYRVASEGRGGGDGKGEGEGRVEMLRVESMEAHWQLFALISQVMSGGRQGIHGVTRILGAMLRNQGMRGIFGYTKGMTRGIFGRGRRALTEFAAALEARDEKSFLALFEEGAQIEFPAGKPVAPGEFFHGIGEPMSLCVSGLTSSGWWSSCVFRARGHDSAKQGVAFFRFAPRSKKIELAQFYWGL